jgi:hypothetical protein
MQSVWHAYPSNLSRALTEAYHRGSPRVDILSPEGLPYVIRLDRERQVFLQHPVHEPYNVNAVRFVA